MTPNRHWFKDYKPCHIPVCLDDNNVIYAAGMGSVVFALVIQGKSLRQIELSNVVHVPLLGNNLLSVLTLTRKHNFDVHIQNSTICFNLNNQSLFEATVREDNSAILNGATITQSALSTSILSPDIWHHQFCHIGQNRLKQLLSGSYVTNLEIKSPQPFSPLPDLCQHCIAGKHHCFPFPHTASNRRTKPLNSYTQICMVQFLFKLLRNINIGSVSLITVHITELSTCYTRNLMHLLLSTSSKHLLKSNQAIRLRLCMMIKGGST